MPTTCAIGTCSCNSSNNRSDDSRRCLNNWGTDGGDHGYPDPEPPIVMIVGSDGQPALGVEVDAVKLADDAPDAGGGDLVVRLHEAVGDRTHITLRTRRRIGAAWSCDLMETPQRGHEVGDGILSITLRPFELVTLRLRETSDWDGRS